jgi:hypothetical protein
MLHRGATALIVALGIITTPAHLGIIELAVALLVLKALAVNRLAGMRRKGRNMKKAPWRP